MGLLRLVILALVAIFHAVNSQLAIPEGNFVKNDDFSHFFGRVSDNGHPSPSP